jgi:hypothetical protein
VSETAVAFVELLRVAAVQLLEPVRQLLPRRVEDEVVVRGHEAEGVDRPVEPLDASPEVREELTSVGVVAEDVAAGDAARDHVEVPVGEQCAGYAGHDSDES